MTEASPFIRDMQQVGVHAEGGLAPLAGRHGDVVLLCIRNELGPAVQVPLPPWSYHLDVWLQAVVPEAPATIKSQPN